MMVVMILQTPSLNISENVTILSSFAQGESIPSQDGQKEENEEVSQNNNPPKCWWGGCYEDGTAQEQWERLMKACDAIRVYEEEHNIISSNPGPFCDTPPPQACSEGSTPMTADCVARVGQCPEDGRTKPICGEVQQLPQQEPKEEVEQKIYDYFPR